MKPSRPILETLSRMGLSEARERLGSRLTAVPSGCLEADGISYNGYASVRFGGPRLLAHRAAWSLANNSDPGELLVCHTCDNRRCCNPDHLFLGTALDNHRDMVAKGRRGKQPTRNHGVSRKATIPDDLKRAVHSAQVTRGEA